MLLYTTSLAFKTPSTEIETYFNSYAKELIDSYIESDNIIDEYIEKAEPILDTIQTTELELSNGSKLFYFFNNHRDQIRQRLIKNPKYNKGYLNLKRKLGVITTIDGSEPSDVSNDELDIMIEKLNNPKLNMSKITKTNHSIITFYRINKEVIENALLTNPKYHNGYDVIRTRVFGSSKIEEYIELLNNHKINVEKFETEVHFSDGELISNFWEKNRKAIGEYLNSSSKYAKGYVLAKLKNELGYSTQSKSKELIKKSIICEKNLIKFEINTSLLYFIPSLLFEKLLQFYIDNKIPYINGDGTLNENFLITEKEFYDKYNMTFLELIVEKEKVNTL